MTTILKPQIQDKSSSQILQDSSSNQRFKHEQLYNFWTRSEGIWFSQLVKVTVKLLDEPELLAISEIYLLTQAEFGVRTNWEFNTKAESGSMTWCVDASQPSLLFTNEKLPHEHLPQIFSYRLVNDNQLAIAGDDSEEIYWLDGNNRRRRELRYQNQLVSRVWETKAA